MALYGVSELVYGASRMLHRLTRWQDGTATARPGASVSIVPSGGKSAYESIKARKGVAEKNCVARGRQASAALPFVLKTFKSIDILHVRANPHRTWDSE